MTRRLLTRACVIALLPLLLTLSLPLRAHALARPGGGHGYSGGGGSRSSGSSRSSSSSRSSRSSSRDDDRSGDDGALGELLVVLASDAVRATRNFPLVMWPIWGLVAVGFVLKMRSAAAAGPDWTTISASRESTPNVLPRVALEALRDVDPDFSLVLFEDFVSALFARAHEARGQGRVADLGAWLSPSAQRRLNDLSRELASVDGILVGSMSYVSVRGITPPEERVVVEIEIEGNYTEHYEPHGRAETSAFWTRERWMLSRSREARTPPPQSNQLRSFGCPTCGAPLTSRSPSVCAHCGRTIEPADFDWLVDTIQARNRQRTPPALTGETQESGTDLETIVDPRAQARCQEIGARDASFTWPAFQARVRHIFTELQPAWSTLDLRRARPYLSDRLFQTWSFWMEAYRREGLTNISDQARITEIALVRVVSDRSFDAITVRVWATGLDYTVDAQGELRSGSRDTPREYSEYWTLIRGRGAAGPPRTDNTCPQCGAAMAVNMGGDCEHCGAHITAGEFDWVLSRVEQDEAYQG